MKKKYHTCYCVCYYEGTFKQFNDTFHTHAENNINALKKNSQASNFFRGCTRLLLSF